MIKALILFHLWSLVIAACVWILQRDGQGRIGHNFPAPGIWFGIILLCFLPGILSLIPFSTPSRFPEVEVFETINRVSDNIGREHPNVLSGLALYFSLSCMLMSHTLWQWFRLQCLPLKATSENGVFTTAKDLPPLTLSWPRRAIVIPDRLENRRTIIRHEQIHLQYADAEVTLGLLLLRDLMLRNFGIVYLVRQWRLAIELRADSLAIQMLTRDEKRDYAKQLLFGLKSGGDHKGGRALPCPTAHLTSTQYRSVKMRLMKIMENKPTSRKTYWKAAISVMGFAACGLGIMSTSALAKDGAKDAAYDSVKYVKRVPPMMPSKCAGLDAERIKIDQKEFTVEGKVFETHAASVGMVNLEFDVRANGDIHNIRVVKSNAKCFEKNAISALSKWKAEPQDKPLKGVSVRQVFLLTGETHEELGAALNAFVQE